MRVDVASTTLKGLFEPQNDLRTVPFGSRCGDALSQIECNKISVFSRMVMHMA